MTTTILIIVAVVLFVSTAGLAHRSKELANVAQTWQRINQNTKQELDRAKEISAGYEEIVSELRKENEKVLVEIEGKKAELAKVKSDLAVAQNIASEERQKRLALEGREVVKVEIAPKEEEPKKAVKTTVPKDKKPSKKTIAKTTKKK